MSSQPNLLEKVIAFVDERVGLKTLQAKMLNEPVPGGSRWAYIFGSVLLFIFIMQVVTGILLMFYYVPSADHAYASTQYIIHEVDYGWFLLSYHFWGSSAMGIMVFAHMSQVFLWGAYKKPREMIWLVGLALFGIVMGFGFTGYLLPWDQRAYWATTVGVEIMDKTPIVGDFMAGSRRTTASRQSAGTFISSNTRWRASRTLCTNNRTSAMISPTPGRRREA